MTSNDASMMSRRRQPSDTPVSLAGGAPARIEPATTSTMEQELAPAAGTCGIVTTPCTQAPADSDTPRGGPWRDARPVEPPGPQPAVEGSYAGWLGARPVQRANHSRLLAASGDQSWAPASLTRAKEALLAKDPDVFTLRGSCQCPLVPACGSVPLLRADQGCRTTVRFASTARSGRATRSPTGRSWPL